MNTRQIEILLKHCKCFKGVYARNQMPIIIKRPSAIIVNTHPDSLPGEHWVTIFLNEDNTADYFDSYGLPPLHKDYYHFLSIHAIDGIRYNSNTLQHITSKTCGGYCVLYVLHRCKGYSHCEFINKFSKNSLLNDKYVLSNISMS